MLVDGFRRIGLSTLSDIDRLEVIKGPAASIYGAIQPGGAVNIITPQPTTVQTSEICITAGTDALIPSVGHKRPRARSTRADTLLYRPPPPASTASSHLSTPRPSRATASSFNVLKTPLEAQCVNTSLNLDVETMSASSTHSTRSWTITEKQTMPWAGNSITESQYYGMATTNPLDYDYAGPEELQRTTGSRAGR